MKFWFDISNSPHINLFSGLVKELKRDGHELKITCRPLANTVDLLQLEKLEFDIVGEHHGKSILRKSLGFPIRVHQLYRHLVSEGVQAGISQSSFHAPVASRLLGIPSIYMNDNEHALGNVPAFLAANRICIPEYLELGKVAKQGAKLSKVRQYPGVKEGIYLWSIAKELDSDPAKQQKSKPTVYVRPEPWTAQYYRGRTNFLDDVILGLCEAADVIVLPRGKQQGQHYMDRKFDCVTVVHGALSIQEIARDCDLFIGAGGTMTREMAVLGVPTISVYQDPLLDVDCHLLRVGGFVHEPDLTPASAFRLLDAAVKQERQKELLEKGQQAYIMIKQELLNIRD